MGPERIQASLSPYPRNITEYLLRARARARARDEFHGVPAPGELIV